MIAADWIVLLVLAAGFYTGFRKGALVSFCSLFALWAGLTGGMRLYVAAGGYLSAHTGWRGPYLSLAGFLAVFLVIFVAVVLLARLFDKVLSWTPAGLANKMAGGLLGACVMFFFLGFVVWALDHSGNISPSWKAGSRTYALLQPVVPAAFKLLSAVLPSVNGWVKDAEALFTTE